MTTKYRMIRIPENLYQEIRDSKERKECLTISECVRKALREFLRGD